MRKTFFILLFALLAVGFVYGISQATPCANCHTMHNSQGGSAIDTDGANEFLLVAQCIECHSGGNTSSASSFGAPKVLTVTGGDPGTNINAGGDFYWVVQGSDAMGHNVSDISGLSDDNTIGLTPPGWDQEATNANAPGTYTWGAINGGVSPWATQLTCGGINGCHGNHTSPTSLAAIVGSHHNNASGSLSTADTIGNSFRFLNGIMGYEDPEYNFNQTASTHNEYLGDDDTNTERDDDATTDYTNSNTISWLCAECHGLFHANIDSDTTFGSPWVRHPTDKVLPSTGEYGNYNPDNAGEYNVDVPVARGAVATSSDSLVNEGDGTSAKGAIVMCLSCHRAHGSPEPDLLRFTYDMDTTASGTADTGCFVCHTQKNND